jgi:membrane associated rhomboid family serine protease
MDLQLFLALNMMSISGLVMLLAIFNRTRGASLWIGVNALVVAAGALALVFLPEWSGVIAAAVFVPLVAAPSALSSWAAKRSKQGDTRGSARLARLAAILHPTRQARFGAELSAALAHDETYANITALEELSARSPPEQQVAIAALIALERGDWQQIVDIVTETAEPGMSLRALEIRALGELGRVEDMVRLYETAKTGMSGAELQMVHLFVLAFAGRIVATQSNLSGANAHLDGDTKAYWQAVALGAQAATRDQELAILERLSISAGRLRVRSAAQRRLDRADRAPLAPLSPAATQIVDGIERRTQRAAEQFASQPWHVPVTFALLMANAAAFGIEVASGGSEDLSVLVDLGALWPPLVWINGEWWRLATSNFLHFGPLHLAANLFILYILGRPVERAYGWLRFAALYAIGGLGSSATVLMLMHVGVVKEGVLIGASGAIFAVFGAEAARQLMEWRRSRDALDRRQLANLALIMLVQVIIDLSVPEISAAAHMSGFLIGFVLGVLLLPRATGAGASTAAA